MFWMVVIIACVAQQHPSCHEACRHWWFIMMISISEHRAPARWCPVDSTALLLARLTVVIRVKMTVD